MSMNDRVADFLTRIRNAIQAGHESVQIPYTTVLERIGNVMLAAGYIEAMQTVGEGYKKIINVDIKYVDGTSAITALERISKPSRRLYVGHKEIKPVKNGMGISIISTPQGVMSDNDARKKNVGGEVICNIW